MKHHLLAFRRYIGRHITQSIVHQRHLVGANRRVVREELSEALQSISTLRKNVMPILANREKEGRLPIMSIPHNNSQTKITEVDVPIPYTKKPEKISVKASD